MKEEQIKKLVDEAVANALAKVFSSLNKVEKSQSDMRREQNKKERDERKKKLREAKEERKKKEQLENEEFDAKRAKGAQATWEKTQPKPIEENKVEPRKENVLAPAQAVLTPNESGDRLVFSQPTGDHKIVDLTSADPNDRPRELKFKNLVAGTNVTLTSTATTITIASTGGGGYDPSPYEFSTMDIYVCVDGEPQLVKFLILV